MRTCFAAICLSFAVGSTFADDTKLKVKVGDAFPVDAVKATQIDLVKKDATTVGIADLTGKIVVVFWYPKDPSVSFIKRVVGVPGDTVELRRGSLYVNDRRVPEEYVRPYFNDDETHSKVIVDKGYYYVLGDHRNSSNDSRSWGEVPEKYIYGKAVFRFWPLSKIGFIQ